LAVEVVTGDEGRLLTLYRTLPPAGQREALAYVERTAAVMLEPETGRTARATMHSPDVGLGGVSPSLQAR